MTPPKRVWLTAAEALGLTDKDTGGDTHEYRLVKPKRETVAYVVKRGEMYLYDHDGQPSSPLTWTDSASTADRWHPKDRGIALQWATSFHARRVRLVRRSTP